VAEVGKTYLGKVVRIVDFGSFVEIFPGTDGLLHISEISQQDQAQPQGDPQRAARKTQEGRERRQGVSPLSQPGAACSRAPSGPSAARL
jgi:polyribonucleotide nucleotidyltransferase